MTDIEHLVEIDNVVVPDYSGREFNEEHVAKQSHRKFVGGRWEDGLRQKEFLLEHGLQPQMKFLDVGAGALRAGRHLIDVLEPGNYYGVDANLDIIRTGYDVELTDEQRAKTPSSNLRANDRFNVDFGVPFDMAIAQSVFTHVSLNHMRLCLYRLGKVMRPGGVFFASFCEQPASKPIDYVYHRIEGGRAYLNEQNIFWYHRKDMRWAGNYGPWDFSYIGKWGSRQGQMMVKYTRISDEEHAARDAARHPKPGPPATGARRIVNGVRRRAAHLLDPDD
jgi:SAM-dependent methyltransferase